MSKFKKYLDEEPLPPEYSTTPKDKGGKFKKTIPYEDIEDQMKDDGYLYLGSGSSRVGLKCTVKVSAFFPEDKQKYDLKGSQVKTVIKLAKNDRGVFQNTVEMGLWEDIKNTPFNRFLCPIFDWSGNPRYENHGQYTLTGGTIGVDVESDYNGALWIQMPTCDLDRKSVTDACTKVFGVPSGSDGKHIDIWDHLFDLNEDNDYTRVAREKKASGASPEQINEFKQFRKMLKKYEIGDVENQGNWGVYKDRPVLVDYGYHMVTTQKVYSGRAQFKVYVNEEGEIKIFYKVGR